VNSDEWDGSAVNLPEDGWERIAHLNARNISNVLSVPLNPTPQRHRHQTRARPDKA